MCVHVRVVLNKPCVSIMGIGWVSCMAPALRVPARKPRLTVYRALQVMAAHIKEWYCGGSPAASAVFGNHRMQKVSCACSTPRAKLPSDSENLPRRVILHPPHEKRKASGHTEPIIEHNYLYNLVGYLVTTRVVHNRLAEVMFNASSVHNGSVIQHRRSQEFIEEHVG